MKLYGNVTVDRFDGKHLPYVDNLVNLIVAEDLGDVGLDEVMRVLVPNGAVCLKQGDRWTTTVKPWPEAIDEWTHYPHGPDNNAVAQDTTVGPPQHLQWVGGPLWSRHHEHLPSMNAMVTAGGRTFYIMDEGCRASIQLPPKWKLIARDAFNGTVLWKRDLPRWYVHTYPLKSGPADLPRRLVATKDRVYLPLGIDQPLSALDAATGQTVHTFNQGPVAEEVVLSEGQLFILGDPEPVAAEQFTGDEPICWWVNYKAIRDRAWNNPPDTSTNDHEKGLPRTIGCQKPDAPSAHPRSAYPSSSCVPRPTLRVGARLESVSPATSKENCSQSESTTH